MASSSNKKAAKARSRAQARAQQSKRRPGTGARSRTTGPTAEPVRVRPAGAVSSDASRSSRVQSVSHMPRVTRPSWVARVTVGLILLTLVVSMFSMLALSTYQ